VSGHLRRVLGWIRWQWTLGWAMGWAAGRSLADGRLGLALGLALLAGLGGADVARWIERRLAYRVKIEMKGGIVTITTPRPLSPGDLAEIQRRLGVNPKETTTT
jgi:hypothetical protein